MLSIVTGGAGFLGSHLVDALLAAGDEVIVADNLLTGSLANLEDASSTGKMTFLYCDVSQSYDVLKPIFARAVGDRRIGRIFHLASPASPDAYGSHPWETLAVNGMGTMSLIDIALEHKARFIFASTSEIYGDPLVHPQPEEYFGNVDPIGPRACYDEGKRFGEAAVSVGVSSRSLDGRIVRFFNCYGPRLATGDGRLIAGLADAALNAKPLPIHGSGLQTRSMTYVADAVRLLLIVAEGPSVELRPVNIGSDHERTILEIAEIFATVAGVPFNIEFSPGRPGDPQRRRPILSRAIALGYVPQTNLEDGLRLTWNWLRNVAPAFSS